MKVDTVIVGAGSAGLSALREVRRYTDDFLLINDGHWSTTCAAAGCMPSKTLIEAANAFHRRHALDAFGVHGADGLRADIPAVLARVQEMRDGFVKGPQSVPGKLGKRAMSGRARLLSPDRIEVNDQEIHARAIILAPGSRPVVPEGWAGFGEGILTTDSLFEQADLPRRIAVIGMGAIGLEMAQSLARLGLEVEGFDAVDGLAGIDDAEVLAAMGRRPNIDDLGLETLGVSLDDKGMPEIDPATLRIGNLPVFLVGDANCYRPLVHEAADEGHIAGRMAAPGASGEGLCRRTPLSIVFASPQVARVGPPLSQLGDCDVVSGTADFSNQARARMAQTAAGLLRIHADRDRGRLLAAEMCVPSAEHLAHLLALAVERKMTVADMLAMPFYHPVIEEGLRRALRDLAKDVAGAGGSDLSDCPAIGQDALD
jgi:dihydrolipoamide dehydrogenase